MRNRRMKRRHSPSFGSTLDSVLNEIAKLERIERIGLPDGLFDSVTTAVVQKYRLRAGPRSVGRHTPYGKYFLFVHLSSKN
jgi:hypothetical protein